MVDPIRASAADVPGSAGEAVGPRRTMHLMVPCKEERNSGGEVTRTKVRITAADLKSNGGVANALATDSAANESGSAGEADGVRHPDAGSV